jgi:hypothetical protein
MAGWGVPGSAPLPRLGLGQRIRALWLVHGKHEKGSGNTKLEKGRSTRVASKIEQPSSSVNGEVFFPKGAIAFFVTVLAGFGLIWLGIYLLLVQRQLWL